MKSFEHQCLDFWRSKPADEEYDPLDIAHCALAKFARHMGGKPGPEWWTDHCGSRVPYSITLMRAAFGGSDSSLQYGPAADRLEALLAEQPQ
jgi:hypothetical protein